MSATEVLDADLVLDGRVLHQPAVAQQHREVPGQLGDRGHLALQEDRRLGRVDAGGEVIHRDLHHVVGDGRGLVGAGRESVDVGDDEEAVVVLLHREAVLDRANVVAQVQPAGGRVAGKDARPPPGFGGVLSHGDVVVERRARGKER
jgi:hypothetical protein